MHKCCRVSGRVCGGNSHKLPLPRNTRATHTTRACLVYLDTVTWLDCRGKSCNKARISLLQLLPLIPSSCSSSLLEKGRTEEEEKSTAPFVILKMGKQTDPPKNLKTCMHVACVYVSHALCCVAGTRAQPQQTSPTGNSGVTTHSRKWVGWLLQETAVKGGDVWGSKGGII